MTTKSMEMNKLSYWQLRLMLVKGENQLHTELDCERNVTKKSVNTYPLVKDSDVEKGACVTGSFLSSKEPRTSCTTMGLRSWYKLQRRVQVLLVVFRSSREPRTLYMN